MSFVEQIAPLVQKYAPQYGIKVCSPIIAQAILESASGTSELAVRAPHNYFGLKYRANRCPSASGIYYKIGSEQNPDGNYSSSAMQWFSFPSMEAGVKGYFEFTNISNYANLKGIEDPYEYLVRIKEDKYATSLDYVSKVWAVVQKYNLTQYDPKPTQTATTDTLTINKSYPCNSGNYGAARLATDIKFLVYHYTANATDTAVANCKYFQTSGRGASAHYFVDEKEICQSVSDTITAWSVGGSLYSDVNSTGGGKLYGVCKNSNSISIEMCSTNGTIAPKTIENAVKLGKMLMQKYNIPLSNVVRHFDVTGKHCIGWSNWINNPTSSNWDALKAKLATASATAETSTSEPPKAVESTVEQSYTTIQVPFLVKVNVDSLNIRKGAGTQYETNGAITDRGIYTIVEVDGKWGKLKSGKGWVHL